MQGVLQGAAMKNHPLMTAVHEFAHAASEAGMTGPLHINLTAADWSLLTGAMMRSTEGYSRYFGPWGEDVQYLGASVDIFLHKRENG